MTNRLLAAAACTLLFVGCAEKTAPPAPEPAAVVPSIDQYNVARSELMKSAGVIVGRVSAGPLDGLVAVDDLPADEFPVGSTVTFVDYDRQPVGGGVVVSRTGDRLHVRVIESPGLRGPQVGDLAVRIRS